jgi:hypothetical protein
MTSDSENREIPEVPDSPNELKMYRYWIAFASMGFLVGNIAGLTSAPITQPLLAAVLAFGGGSIIAFQTKLDKERLLPGALDAVAAFSLATLIGLYGALYVTAKYPTLLSSPTSAVSSKPLRSGSMDTCQDILRKVSEGTMTLPQASEILNKEIDE